MRSTLSTSSIQALSARGPAALQREAARRIKLAQGKDPEASDAIWKAIEKVYSLEMQGKFIDLMDSTDESPVSLKDHLYAAKSCVDNP